MSILNRKLLNTIMVPALGLKSPSQMGFFYSCCCTRKWVIWNLRSEEKEKEKQKSEELVCGWFDWDKSAEDCVKDTVDRRWRAKKYSLKLDMLYNIRQKKLRLRANVVTKVWSTDLDHQFSGASCTFYLLHLSFLWNLEISSIFSLSWIWLF